MKNRTRLLAATTVALIGLTACGSDSKSTATTTTQAPATAAPTTSVAPSTTEAPTTTQTPTTLATTTTHAPTTTAAPTTVRPTTTVAAKLSREAKLAVTKCLDDLSVPATLLADLVALDDMTSTDAAAADCKDAGTQVGVDIHGSQLAVSLSDIVFHVLALKVAYVTEQSLEVGSDAANAYMYDMPTLVAKAQQQFTAAS